MDKQSHEILTGILSKNPGELTQEEVGFLNARAWALTDEQKRVFASVLREPAPVAPVEEVPAEVETTPEVQTQPAEAPAGDPAPVAPETTQPTETTQYAPSENKDPDAVV